MNTSGSRLNTISDEGIANINTLTKLVLKRRGDSAIEFLNAANRLYVLHFIEVAEIGGHRVVYFLLRLAEGKRGGPADKEAGRMIVAIIVEYLKEHPDELVCYCHSDNAPSIAINRIFHLWARNNSDIIDGYCSFFDGTGHDADKRSLHFMVIYNLACEDITELKASLQENSDDFAVCVREQIVLLHHIEDKFHNKQKK